VSAARSIPFGRFLFLLRPSAEAGAVFIGSASAAVILHPWMRFTFFLHGLRVMKTPEGSGS
jgi:hypothetical protein